MKPRLSLLTALLLLSCGPTISTSSEAFKTESSFSGLDSSSASSEFSSQPDSEESSAERILGWAKVSAQDEEPLEALENDLWFAKSAIYRYEAGTWVEIADSSIAESLFPRDVLMEEGVIGEVCRSLARTLFARSLDVTCQVSTVDYDGPFEGMGSGVKATNTLFEGRYAVDRYRIFQSGGDESVGRKEEYGWRDESGKAHCYPNTFFSPEEREAYFVRNVLPAYSFREYLALGQWLPGLAKMKLSQGSDPGLEGNRFAVFNAEPGHSQNPSEDWYNGKAVGFAYYEGSPYIAAVQFGTMSATNYVRTEEYHHHHQIVEFFFGGAGTDLSFEIPETIIEEETRNH